MPFLTKGKENWKYILIVSILAIIVGGGILVWQYFIKPNLEIAKEIMEKTKPPPDKETIKELPAELNPISPTKLEPLPKDIKVYRNEKYGFAIEYFTDKLAVEKEYVEKKLIYDPYLLFEVLFYDSEYGSNKAKTKYIPMISVEVLECKEKETEKCFNLLSSPRRLLFGTYGEVEQPFKFETYPARIIEINYSPKKERVKGIAIIKDQFLYAVLVRIASEEFKPVPSEFFKQMVSTFRFLE
jgi:hypothetical protein